MIHSDHSPKRVAYVVKRYPRLSETFIVSEILAHEAAGIEICIFALRPAADSYFQPAICQVRAPLTYVCGDHIRADELWSQLQLLANESPQLWSQIAAADRATGSEVYQAARLAQEIRSRGIEHIHAHFATTAATVARLSSLFTGIPYTFTAHAKDIFHESVDAAELAQKIDGAAAVATVSDFNLQFLRAQFEDSAPKLHRIYNGLDLKQFEFSRPDDRPPKIVAVGRLVEKKGFDILINACALLSASGVAFHCEIVGGGERELALRQQIDQLNLSDIVRLVGPRPLTYVEGAIRQAAVLAVPSITASSGDRDGLPTVLLEAMALGTPVVATTVTGIPEAVCNEESGLLVPERRPCELAAALKRLLFNSELRERLAFAARSTVERQFDIHRSAAELREVFTNCRQAAKPVLSLAEVS